MALSVVVVAAAGAGVVHAAPVCTVRGTAGDDVLYGTSRDDVICGGGGADTIYGRGGRDRLLGDSGKDTLYGGPGKDLLRGGDDYDVVRGNDGDDVLTGGDGGDRMHGGGGDDDLRGGPGDDVLDGNLGANTCAGGLGVDIIKPTCDSAPPQVHSLALAPTTVDTSDSNVWVTATIDVSDNLSGVAGGVIWLRSPSGAQTGGVSWSEGDFYSGDTLDRVYAVRILLPRYSEQGTWTASAVQLSDAVGNTLWLDSVELHDRGLDVTVQQTGLGDVTAPRITSLEISPRTLDTSAGPAAVTVDVGLRDDLSGVEMGTVQFAGPSGQRATAWLYGEKRVSGDELDGHYRYEVVMPQWSAKGAWTVEAVNLRDQAGNMRSLGTDNLADAGFDVSFSQTGADDTEEPSLESLSISPSIIDTADAAATIVLRARITDNRAGYGHGNFAVSSSSGQQRHSVFIDETNRVSGDANDGVYRAKITIPRYAERGWWRASGIDLRDGADNRRWTALPADTATFFNGP